MNTRGGDECLKAMRNRTKNEYGDLIHPWHPLHTNK
jgi:hypothetical protein